VLVRGVHTTTRHLVVPGGDHLRKGGRVLDLHRAALVVAIGQSARRVKGVAQHFGAVAGAIRGALAVSDHCHDALPLFVWKNGTILLFGKGANGKSGGNAAPRAV